MEYRLQPRGLAVLSLWLCLPGCALSAFFFWQSILAGLVFLCLWVAAALILCLGRGGTVRVRCERGELQVRAGLVFRSFKRLPARFVSGVGLASTPLLALAGCRILSIHSAGIVLALAGLSAADAEALAALLGGAPGGRQSAGAGCGQPSGCRDSRSSEGRRTSPGASEQRSPGGRQSAGEGPK